MNVTLSQYSRTFATRERARELISDVPHGVSELVLDLSGVRASPSFLAEILGLLSARAGSVSVVGADKFHQQLVSSLIAKLGLADRVRTAVAA